MKNLFKRAIHAASTHSSEILLGIGIMGYLSAIVMSARIAPDTMRSIERAESEKGEELTKVESAKIIAKHYIPVMVLGTTATYCVIRANNIRTRQVAGLSTLYQITESKLSDYREAVKEVVDTDTAEKIDKTAASKALHANVPEGIACRPGEYVFYDPLRAELFPCNKDRIDAAMNLIRLRLSEGYDWVPVNEFWEQLGLRPSELGDYFGWSNHGNWREEWPRDVSYSGDCCGENGQTCTVISYDVYASESLMPRDRLSGCDRILR